jgi:hypothetical protein
MVRYVQNGAFVTGFADDLQAAGLDAGLIDLGRRV